MIFKGGAQRSVRALKLFAYFANFAYCREHSLLTGLNKYCPVHFMVGDNRLTPWQHPSILFNLDKPIHQISNYEPIDIHFDAATCINHKTKQTENPDNLLELTFVAHNKCLLPFYLHKYIHDYIHKVWNQMKNP